jgi:small conductance mechanosensitive channel
VIIPNGALSNGAMVNLTAEPQARIDLVFGVEYGASIEKTRALMMGVLEAQPKVLKDPAPSVTVLELADSSVNFAVRPWVKTEDYWDVFFDLQSGMKQALDAAKIAIPFPQRDVHIFNN